MSLLGIFWKPTPPPPPPEVAVHIEGTNTFKWKGKIRPYPELGPDPDAQAIFRQAVQMPRTSEADGPVHGPVYRWYMKECREMQKKIHPDLTAIGREEIKYALYQLTMLAGLVTYVFSMYFSVSIQLK